MAEALKIEDAAKDLRCTSCHAPFQGIPESAKAGPIPVSEAVSCESCHGAAEPWQRSHTRKDYIYADRIQAGMRDLKNLYVRANTCVACHQQVDAALLKAGHPELIFELDGQAVTEPKHWREAKDWSGAQTWLVGQAAALRESSWHLSKEKAPGGTAATRWQAQFWLLSAVISENRNWASWDRLTGETTPENLRSVQQAADDLAKVAAQGWPKAAAHKTLRALAEKHAEFSASKASRTELARRAELLVLALERLTLGVDAASKGNSLKQLFADVQVLPDFSPSQFSQHLKEFQQSLPAN